MKNPAIAIHVPLPCTPARFVEAVAVFRAIKEAGFGESK